MKPRDFVRFRYSLSASDSLLIRSHEGTETSMGPYDLGFAIERDGKTLQSMTLRKLTEFRREESFFSESFTTLYVARLESGRVMPSTLTLERFAKATRTKLRISFEPVRAAERWASAAHEFGGWPLRFPPFPKRGVPRLDNRWGRIGHPELFLVGRGRRFGLATRRAPHCSIARHRLNDDGDWSVDGIG